MHLNTDVHLQSLTYWRWGRLDSFTTGSVIKKLPAAYSVKTVTCSKKLTRDFEQLHLRVIDWRKLWEGKM